MKHPLIFMLALALAASAQDDEAFAEKVVRHQTGARQLSDEQDELAADVQQLTIEQTAAEVIELFREVEGAMDDSSERLWSHETGGETIAAQTDVIEKIYEAAKARQQSGGSGEAGGAMMDMLQRMLGIEPQPGQAPGQQAGDQGGEGMTGESDTANDNEDGNSGGKVTERRVPKGAGTAGRTLPAEFRAALKAYNRAADDLDR